MPLSGRRETWSCYSLIVKTDNVFGGEVNILFQYFNRNIIMKNGFFCCDFPSNTLLEMRSNTEFFLVRMLENTNQKKLRIWTLFKQWHQPFQKYWKKQSFLYMHQCTKNGFPLRISLVNVTSFFVQCILYCCNAEVSSTFYYWF